MAIRPFRALRYSPDRVQLGLVAAPAFDLDPARVEARLQREPRNVLRLLTGEGVALFLAEWQRARVLVKDDAPGLYALKRVGGGGEAGKDGTTEDEPLGFFAVVDVTTLPPQEDDAERGLRLSQGGASIEPLSLRFVDDNNRARRVLLGEIDREPDAQFQLDGEDYELWAIDDDTACARVAAALQERPLQLDVGHAALGAQQALWAAVGDPDDDQDPRRYALCFLSEEAQPFGAAPAGVVLAPFSSPAARRAAS